MMKRVLAFGLCLALLMISSAGQEKGSSLSLPQTRGAWVIELSRSGGMRPRKESVSINSDGEILVTSEHFSQGNTVVDCSLKEELSATDLFKLKRAVRLSNSAAWRENYDDPKHPVCCDQPTTRLTLHLRGACGAEKSYNTSWYPGSSNLRPHDLAAVAEVAQTLWNKSSEHCGN